MIREKLDRILEITLCVILSAMVLDVSWQVISRYLLNAPSTFTDELAAFLLIWLGILGGAYVYGKGEHLSIGFIVEKFSTDMQRRVKYFIDGSVFLFCFAVMFVGGIWLVYTRFLLGVQSAALQINWGYVYLVIPISGLIICYYIIDNLIKFKKRA